MKTVILICPKAAFVGDDHAGAERWGVNTTYRIDPSVTKIYHMDSFDGWPDGEKQKVIAELAALDIPVILQKPHPDIPKSEALALDDLIGLVRITYFTSTVAYMLADAIRMGFERIVLHRILRLPHSMGYIEQKSCLDFWAGVAIGRGIDLMISDDCAITKPYTWQPSLYGYVEMGTGQITTALLASAVRASLRLGHEKVAA